MLPDLRNRVAQSLTGDLGICARLVESWRIRGEPGDLIVVADIVARINDLANQVTEQTAPDYSEQPG